MENPLRRPVVLIVDDDKIVHLVIGRILKDYPGTVLHCDNGAKALAVAMDVRPDLIITDALLPGLDGRELARVIKTSPDTAHCKVAVITGLYKGLRYRNEAINRFQVDEYLEKPVNVDQIRELVASVTTTVSTNPVRETDFALVSA